MAFKSLFIGVDRYESPLISNLSCSVRDAQALHGLLGDAFGAAESTLLANEQATKAAILAALHALQRATPDDVVVISFSGHGSDSHHLITYDADPLRLDETAIHLDSLTDLFASIPAKNVLLLLDCCFAGGAGAKVFHAPVATKSPASAAALLDKISGRGRVIFTAATAEQEAIEDRRRGHGLFTFFVIEALRGAPEVVRGATVPLLALFDFVTRSVVQAARQIRHEQEPTFKGAIEGELALPVLTPGALFRSFFPDYGPVTVGPNIDDLAGYGFPTGILERLHESIPSLNELQQEAINKAGLFTGQHLVVSAPTSSGKTMIGELAALYGYSKGERTYMLLPLRALVNDKYEEFTRKYAAFGLRIIRSTGEISDDNDLLFRGKFNIALLTYERFAALAVTLPHLLRQVGVIVIDEVQMITDPNRGANLEFLLTLLKVQRLLGIEPQRIALSAVIGDTNGLEAWLDARLIVTDKRPVPLDEGMLDMSGTFRYLAAGKEEQIQQYMRPEYRKGSSQDIIIPLVRKLVSEGEKVIVFRETKPIVRATAEYLKNNLGLSAARETLDLMPSGDPSTASAQLRGCLEHGVAFHNADLDREERQAIETTFRDPRSSLKVLVATTTLAMGVNTPAWSVVIAGLEHPDSPYSVAEYKNMVGRAGRLGYTTKGKSFLIAANNADAYLLWSKYVLGHPEALVSRFADQEPLSLVCRVLATAAASKTDGLSAQELVDFVQSTFAAHRQGSRFDGATIRSVLQRLAAAGLVETFDDRFRLTELGKVAGELGIQVESVVRIARALRGLSAQQVTDAVLLAAAQTTIELDDVLIPVHKKSIKERQRWTGAIDQQRLPHSVVRELRATDDPSHTARCKRLSAALMWIDGVELNRLEQSLLVHLPGDNAAGPIRAVAERTRDLIGVVARIAALVSADRAEPRADVAGLSTRLELGIPGDLLWLASTVKRGLERGDYLALQRAGLPTFEALDRVEDAHLAGVLKSDAKMRRIRDGIAKAKLRQPVGTDDLPLPRPA
jgi:helicase